MRLRAHVPRTHTAMQMARFLEAYRSCGIVEQASRATGVPRTSVWRWRTPGEPGYCELFAKEYARAESLADLALEDEAKRLAFNGSEKVLLFLLERRQRSRYGHHTEVTHKGEVKYVKSVELPEGATALAPGVLEDTDEDRALEATLEAELGEDADDDG